jgi:hypothetical protein
MFDDIKVTTIVVVAIIFSHIQTVSSASEPIRGVQITMDTP